MVPIDSPRNSTPKNTLPGSLLSTFPPSIRHSHLDSPKDESEVPGFFAAQGLEIARYYPLSSDKRPCAGSASDIGSPTLRDNFLRLLDALDGIPHPVRAEARRLLRITPSGRFRPPPRLSGALTQLLSGVSPGELREWLDASSASEGRRQTFLRRIGGLLRRFRSQVRRHAIASASSQGASHPEPPDSDHGTDSDDSAPSSSPSGSDGHSTPSLSPSDASSDSDGPRPPSASAGRAQRSPPPPAGAHCSPPPPAGPQGDPASPSRTIDTSTTDPHTPPSAEPQGPETPLPSSSDSDSGSDALAPGPDRPRSRPRRNPPDRPTLATAEPDTMLIHPMPLLSLLSLPDRQHDATQAPLSGHQTRSFPLQAPLPDPKSSDIYGWLD